VEDCLDPRKETKDQQEKKGRLRQEIINQSAESGLEEGVRDFQVKRGADGISRRPTRGGGLKLRRGRGETYRARSKVDSQDSLREQKKKGSGEGNSSTSNTGLGQYDLSIQKKTWTTTRAVGWLGSQQRIKRVQRNQPFLQKTKTTKREKSAKADLKNRQLKQKERHPRPKREAETDHHSGTGGRKAGIRTKKKEKGNEMKVVQQNTQETPHNRQNEKLPEKREEKTPSKSPAEGPPSQR